MILSSLYLISCDEEYDLTKDINTDITIGNQFRIPAGHSDTIYLSRIIDESETLTENNGIYEVTSTGNTNTQIDPLDEVQIHNFTPVLENIHIDLPANATFPEGTRFDAGEVTSIGNYDIYEELPKEVEQLYRADFKNEKINTTLRLSISSTPAGVEAVTLSNLAMTFPDFIRLTNGTNSFHADEVVLLPIYPAREEPIEGVTSELIARQVTVPCRIVAREELVETVAAMPTDVVISFGAGNIDACCEALAEVLREGL